MHRVQKDFYEVSYYTLDAISEYYQPNSQRQKHPGSHVGEKAIQLTRGKKSCLCTDFSPREGMMGLVFRLFIKDDGDEIIAEAH